MADDAQSKPYDVDMILRGFCGGDLQAGRFGLLRLPGEPFGKERIMIRTYTSGRSQGPVDAKVAALPFPC